VTWSSSNSNVATVNTTGLVEAKVAGTATITVTTADGAKTATCVVAVTAAPVPVTGIALTPTTLTVNKGATGQITANVQPSNATNKTVTWTSNNTQVAMVNEKGEVSGMNGGQATITATTQDGGFTATCTVTVNVPVTGVTVNPTTLSIMEGNESQLTATVAPTDASNKNVTWSSSNTSVATVNTTGLVEAKAAGTATITVTTVDGAKTATCTVTVTAAPVPVTGVVITPEALELEKGATSQLTANVLPTNATNKKVTWNSYNTQVATVNEKGLVTALNGGSAIIYATTEEGGFTDTCSVKVIVRVTGITVNPTKLTIMDGDEAQITATVSPTDATNKIVTWSSSNTKVATVNATGLVYAVAVGSATITATTSDGSFKATCAVNVTEKPVAVTGITVTPTTLVLKPGESGQLTATVEPQNASNKNVTWSSNNSRYISVDQNGLVTMSARPVGGAIITATTEDGGFTATCTVSQYVSVTGITLDKEVHYMAAGKTTISPPVTATVLPSNATDPSVTWSSSNELIARVTQTGNLTSYISGTCSITATTNDGGFSASYTLYVGDRVTGVTLNKTVMDLYSPYWYPMYPGSEQLIATISPTSAVNKKVTWSSSDPSLATVDQNGVVQVVTNSSAQLQCTITVTTDDGGKTASCTLFINRIN
ncbi:MAG: Ig-like domain-containing protein, partial [Bacteroidota bacterium]